MNDNKVEEIRQRARKNYSLGYNCAESVFEAIIASVETGLPSSALKLATGFGGGIGLFGDTCGALVGAVLAVGSVHGREKLPQSEEKKEVLKQAVDQLYGKPGLYRLFNAIPNRFQEKYQYTTCRELIAEWKDNWHCREKALFCRELITDAAGIAALMIFADKDELVSKQFSKNVRNLID